MDFLEVGIDVGLQLHLSLLDQLHHRRRGEKFGHRGDLEKRFVRINRRLRIYISMAIALLEEDGAVLDHHEHDAGDVQGLRPLGEKGIQKGRQFFSVGGSLGR